MSVGAKRGRLRTPRPAVAGGPPTGFLRRLRPPRNTFLRSLMITAAAGLGVFILSEVLSPFDNLRLASVGYYFAALAGLTVLTGLNGQISLGHGALMAVGAYTSVIFITRDGWALAPALVASTVVTAILGIAVGAVAARLRGPYLAGATLALAVGLPGLADKYQSAFGGDNGLQAPPPTPPSWLGANFPLERWQAWISGLGALIVLLLLLNLTQSRFGRAFRAVRDDEVAAQVGGLNVARTQVIAFVVSAACAGLAGGLLVVVTSLAAPGAFTLSLSLSLLTGIVLGGLGSLTGALWGAIALVMLPSWTHDIANKFSVSSNVQSNLPLALYGVILIAVIVAAPQGIQGALRGGARMVSARARGRASAGRAGSKPSNREEGVT